MMVLRIIWNSLPMSFKVKLFNIQSIQNQFVFVSCYSCDSIDKLRSKLPNLEADLRDSVKFKDLYQFTFNFAKNPGQKSLGKIH